MPTQKTLDRAAKINCTVKQLQGVYAQYKNIKYRCGKGRYNNAKFLLGTFDDFIEWIAAQGGFRTSPHGHAYHVSRIRDQGDYEYSNIRFCSHAENLRETAHFWLVTDLKTSRQELFQGNLADKLKELFNVEATSGAYTASKTGNLYLGRFKINKLEI
ncbi:hypothetical protein BC355_17520 [Vibrio cholerae]|uniref:Uncharacterized protein n=1 Tax=Vibrio cholerae TaxID=666 RepID=A0A395TF72_VIBCL|nr:hypothetical protein [Vibrio cholerae]RGP82825.1 hypothetical protein BC354_18125 [Vibrio cholerae]RGP82998.1 hypothetical protein BC355_17520 [Vibrio cholerae]RGP83344.1 hypothetical protein BC353_17480 [Vibrio cholerae]RGP95675.1 hypothetical protein BC352_18675 [Vibrio cholerae]